MIRIPKSNGRLRVIHAPCPELKEKQRAYLENEYRTGIGPGPYAKGFVLGRGILDHALPHVGKKYVVEVDIKDFFHSVRREGVAKAWVMEKLLDSELNSRGFPISRFDWKKAVPPLGLMDLAFIEKKGGSFLPQGSPLSPYLANLALKGADFKIARLLKNKFAPGDRASYTRYADNLVLSADSKKVIPIARHAVQRILESLGFCVNVAKFRVMRKSASQRICGVVVNEKPSIPRSRRREIRGRVENLFKDALHGKAVDPKELASVEGLLSQGGYIAPGWARKFSEKMSFVRLHVRMMKKSAERVPGASPVGIATHSTSGEGGGTSPREVLPFQKDG